MTHDRPDSLGELVSALRSGELSFDAYFEHLENLVAEREPQILALLPEPERFDRLRLDAKRLEERFPQSRDRPALFGVPVGVKDIFHVDGFVTHAGSSIPAEELVGPPGRLGDRASTSRRARLRQDRDDRVRLLWSWTHPQPA